MVVLEIITVKEKGMDVKVMVVLGIIIVREKGKKINVIL